MKLLFVHPAHIDYPGGAERFIVEVGKRLRLEGYDIGVLYVDWPKLKLKANNSHELLKFGIKLYRCNYLKFKRGFPVIDLYYLNCLVKHYDAVYLSAYSPNELVVAALKELKVLKKPFIAVFHSMLEPYRDALHALYFIPYITAYRKFEKLHVLNEFMYSLFIKRYGFNKEKVVLIPNGVDCNFYKPRFAEQAKNKRFVILSVMRFAREKGVDILYELISLINERHRQLRNELLFRIAGSGPLQYLVEKLADEYENVSFLGYLNAEQLVHEYSSADLFLMTSLVENSPLALLEASSCGLPAVASMIPGITDVIKVIKIGLLVRPFFIEDYVNGIIHFYNIWKENPEEYNIIKAYVRERTASHFDWSIIIKKIKKMIKVLLNAQNEH